MMFRVRSCQASDAASVDQLLRESYYPEEPLTKANGLQAARTGITSAVLPQGHSIMAVTDSGRVVGVAINEEPPQAFLPIYTNTIEDLKFQEMFSYMEKASGVLREAPGAMEVRMLAVASDWRQRGVATALLEASRKAALRARCPFLKLYCTSNHTSRLMQKLGWRLLYSLSYYDYLARNPSDIAVPPGPHATCDLFVLDIAFDPVLDIGIVRPLEQSILPSGILMQY